MNKVMESRNHRRCGLEMSRNPQNFALASCGSKGCFPKAWRGLPCYEFGGNRNAAKALSKGEDEIWTL